VFFHPHFTENYQLYSRSYFVKGFELAFLLIVYKLFRKSYDGNIFNLVHGTYMAFHTIFVQSNGFCMEENCGSLGRLECWIKNPGGVGV
jgi:callose synthase